VKRASALGSASLAILLIAAPDALAQSSPEGTWEINGIRLEKGQVERLAEDMADRTVAAVERKVEDIDLSEEQRSSMRAIYLEVSLDVYAKVVDEAAREDLDDRTKEDRVRELVLAGQRRSHERLTTVLDERQMARYSEWEKAQVEAYRSRRWDRRSRRRRR
jgi:hypothetical protein